VPSGLSTYARIAAGIVLGVLVLHLAISIYYGHEKKVTEAATFATSVAERALDYAEVEKSRPDLVGVFQTPTFSIRAVSAPTPVPARDWPHSEEVRLAVVARLRQLGIADAEAVRVHYDRRGGDDLLQLQLPAGGHWLEARALAPRATGHTVIATFWASVMSLAVLAAMLWATRRFTSYLPRLADAADAIGRTSTFEPLPVDGPRELRRVSTAFNAMQGRVSALLEERMTMLGALSHDVRTLITRVALRVEQMPQAELRERAEEDIDAIARLLDEALAFARDEADPEPTVDLDLPSLLESLVEDERDSGRKATYEGPDTLTIEGQPAALRRAFLNIVDNALRYGGAAAVRLECAGDTAVVDVTDPGEGFAPAETSRALKPFVRLETSRNREMGGSGLGLAIVDNVVRRHHGSLEFARLRPGFRVRVVLPCDQRGTSVHAGHQK